MGMRPSEVAPRSTMAREAMRMAMPFRMAARVNHMGYWPLLAGTVRTFCRPHEILALEDDLVSLGEARDDLDVLLVRRPELHGESLHRVVPHHHDAGRAITDAQCLEGYGEHARARLHHRLHARKHAGLEPGLRVGDLHLDAHGSGAGVEAVHDARDGAREDLALVGIGGDADGRTHLDSGDVALRYLDLHLDARDVLEEEDTHGGVGGAR